ncbi:hypothetical protein G6O69_19185 [Pseudenhygromyxa sp. WMMC2535]|uniref:hypothetical protein n=1 Tax=Pseudenhygromyxa sp. WMMC2535 TaxID=2712867 RepID=UPI001556D601|nr:hypothetical protein [Pseudenhygromyxa sp. WMMC2535]NVB39977.1 hypothetical protein [Pseudenhygromyxa sp. WMMC2535]
MSTRSLPNVLVLASFALALAACDDKTPSPPAKIDEGKSVLQGGEARTAPGRQLEGAKQEIEGAEAKMQRRNDKIFEKANQAEDRVERGVP